MKQILRNAALAIALLACTTSVYAQSDNANVSGVVSDPSGSAVPKAKIVLKNQATGLVREAATTDAGSYSIPTVPPGLYPITVEAAGFKKFESKDNKVDPSLPANISVTLQVGNVTETVEVTATASLLQTESGTLGKIVEGKQISDLQLNGRNAVFL